MRKMKSKRQRNFETKSNNALTSRGRTRDAVFQRDEVQYDTKRATRRQATWMEKHAAPVAFVIGSAFGWILFLFLIAGLLTISARTLASMSLSYGWTSLNPLFESIRNHNGLFAGSFAYAAGQWWLLLPASVIGLMASIAFGKQAAKTIAKLDDSAMKTDVNDSWIWSVREMIEQYQVMPDYGAHTKTASASSLVGHIYLKDKGLKSINMAKHDEMGNIMYDDEGNVLRERVPLIDRRDIRKVLDMQGLEELDVNDILIDATKYQYDRKNGKVRTLAQAINEDWYMPDYEFLRPMGAYFVEQNSVHTLILSMTRGNKTQLVSFATVDAWRRDNRVGNIVVNDPKGEMEMASYQLLQRAGYDVIPFSLSYSDKSVRYNPLQMVIEDIRRGRIADASTNLDTLSTTFFPSSGGDDFWIQTARAVFQMMTYQLMNYMVEEEQRTVRLVQAKKAGQKLVDQAESLGNKVRPEIKTPAALDNYIDSLWGNANMNAMYLMISQLDNLKIPDPIEAATDDKYRYNESEEPKAPEEISGLDALAKAIRILPDNGVRRQFKGPDTMMNKAGGSDATVGSIYATALNSMSFFVQETIKKLTTVSPRNGLNILDFPFPRRLSVRINPILLQKMHLASRRYRAVMYKDPFFTKPYGMERHETMEEGSVESTGWMNFWFNKIPRPKTKQFYMKFEIFDRAEENVVITLYFAIDKRYLLSEDGLHYIADPITGRPIVKDGTVFEVQPMTKERALALVKRKNAVKMSQLRDVYASTRKFGDTTEPVVAQTMYNYTEQPKALFMSIPPQIEGQGKLGLTLVDSIFGTSSKKGYDMRGDTQKPDYGTRYMLEELGNLTADGKGLPGMEAKLSIGLSAKQQMTMVFQGMKQVSSVYGDNMYDVMKDNVGTIHYMLSSNKDTLEYISDLTGKTHRVDISSQNISEVVGSINGNDNTISTTKSKSEIPVISPDALKHLTDGETVAITPTHRRDNFGRVSRTNAIFNTREQLLPFAYAVLAKQTKATERSGHGTAETASTIYSTVDSSPDQMVPDFMQILRLTIRQAMYYAHREDYLKDKYKDLPFGSEMLSDAIMNYMNYEEDINCKLIEDGLGSYMLLTKTEIITAVNKKYMDRSQGDVLLKQLGFDPDEVFEQIATVDNYVESSYYLDELSKEQFHDFMVYLLNEANSSDETNVGRQIFDTMLNEAKWGAAGSNLQFRANDRQRAVFSRDGEVILKVEDHRYGYTPNDEFAALFADNSYHEHAFADKDITDLLTTQARQFAMEEDF